MTTPTTFQVTTMADALFEMLRDAPTLAEIKYKERGEYVNDSPSMCPWLGVYRGKRRETPWTLGRGTANWKSQPQAVIIVQESGLDSGYEVETRLERWVGLMLDIIKADPQLKNTVGTIIDIEVNYSYGVIKRDKEQRDVDELDVHFQQAHIILTAEVRT